MTEIDQDRKELNDALKNIDRRLLLLSGSDDTNAKAIHDKAEQVQEKWQRTFWIRDLQRLTDKEKEAWFAAGGRYAVLGKKKNADGEWERYVCKRGAHADLSNPTTGLKILKAFASCTKGAGA